MLCYCLQASRRPMPLLRKAFSRACPGHRGTGRRPARAAGPCRRGAWNEVLARLGSGFRFGAVSTGGSASSRAIRVVLSEATNFISHASRISSESAVVMIRGAAAPPMSIPNVARNVIFHELGHAIGISHNSDPASVMCGRPAPCRPDLFGSSTPHYFPLNSEDRAKVLAMYPAGWKSR